MKNQENSAAFSENNIEDIKIIDLIPHKQFLENLPVAAYYCDHMGRLNYFNKHASELWGTEPALGKINWHKNIKFFKGDQQKQLKKVSEPLSKAIGCGRKIDKEEFVIETRGGNQKRVISTPRLYFNSENKVTGGFNLLVDVTEIPTSKSITREKTEKVFSMAPTEEIIFSTQSFRKHVELYQKMVEEVQDYAILLLDVDGTILNWNKGAEKIKGYTEEEIIGKNFRIFYLDEDRENKLPERLINIAKVEGRAMQEGWRRRKDGNRFWGFIVITALHDSDNNVIGFSKVTRDLSERKESEDQLRMYAQNIELQNKQLEEFAYVASHDLQEPLRKIQIFSEMLEKNIDHRDTLIKYINKINYSAERMSSLIKDVLKYSQLTKPDELWSVLNLNETLKNVIDDHDLLIEEKKAVITVDPLPLINAIPIQMHQLFTNLIGNALKFTTESPKIEIRYSKTSIMPDQVLKPINEENLYHRIDVKDNGIGFEPKYQEHIFKLFKRLDKDKQGTGIGLALCQKIVENHNGSIKVKSDRNKGTTFSIYLPS